MSPPNQPEITINLDGLVGELQLSLQTAINFVAISLQATPPRSMDDLRLPQAVFATTFAQSARWSHVEALEKYQTWAIANGLRDAVEGVSSFSESAHKVLTLWGLASANGGRVSFGDYQAVIEGAAFHRLGLPDKLSHLKAEHGVALDQTLERQILSVNNARNCLVHRNGIVSLRDLNTADSMVVEWRKLHVFLEDEDGEYELIIGKLVEKESTLCVRTHDYQKAFSLGERVSFTIQEFADAIWGIYSFGTNLVDLVRRVNPDKSPDTLDRGKG